MPVTETVYREYRCAQDRERYHARRHKQAAVSIEQLRECGWDIPADREPVDEAAERAYLIGQLGRALHSLTDEELNLIQELFYLEKSEREVAKRLQISQNTLHYRKSKVLGKLRKFLERF